MQITVEGTVVESALDIYARVGKNTALDRQYNAQVSDGLLQITFAKSGASRKTPVISRSPCCLSNPTLAT